MPSSLTPNDYRETTATIALSYNGEDRTPTLSGKKPTNSTITINARSILIAGAENIPYGGADTATMTITLPATSKYPADTATLTFVNVNLSRFEDI